MFPYNVHNSVIEEKPEESTSQADDDMSSAVFETNISKELEMRFRATNEEVSEIKSEAVSFVKDMPLQ